MTNPMHHECFIYEEYLGMDIYSDTLAQLNELYGQEDDLYRRLLAEHAIESAIG